MSALARTIRASVFFYPLGLWILMAVVAVANGIVRETVIVPRIGEYSGHVLILSIASQYRWFAGTG
ncbi:MAG: hypothetical protein ABEK02_07850 [Haloquadratum sp.]